MNAEFAAYPMGMDKATEFLDQLRAIVVFFIDHPALLVVIAGVIIVVQIGRAVQRGRPIVTDDLEAKRLAGGRCEHSALGFRCRTPGGHADHIYPWSRGGRTTMANCQSLCPKHNLQKSAHIPSKFYIYRLEIRRKRYFPEGVSRKVDWRSAV